MRRKSARTERRPGLRGRTLHERGLRGHDDPGSDRLRALRRDDDSVTWDIDIDQDTCPENR